MSAVPLDPPKDYETSHWPQRAQILLAADAGVSELCISRDGNWEPPLVLFVGEGQVL